MLGTLEKCRVQLTKLGVFHDSMTPRVEDRRVDIPEVGYVAVGYGPLVTCDLFVDPNSR